MFLRSKHLDFRRDNLLQTLPGFINAERGIQFMIPGSRDAFLNSLILVNIRDTDMQITITTRRFAPFVHPSSDPFPANQSPFDSLQ